MSRVFLRFIFSLAQFTFCLLFLSVTIALADSTLPAEVPPDQFLTAVWTSIGGLKGAGILGGVVIFTQLMIKFCLTKWADFEGHWKLAIVLGLTWLSGVLGLMAGQHLSFPAALLHSTSLAAFQVFGFELYSQLTQAMSSPPRGQAGDPPNPEKPPA